VAVQRTLSLRFLGGIEIRKGNRVLPLPQSKKTRALLAYLVVSEGPQRRERLCSLLWDVTDDPRGALRWSLSKLRALVDAKDQPRIVANRDLVSFDSSGVAVDLFTVRDRIAKGTGGLSTAGLAALADEFRGEFLEGLELNGFLEFQVWLAARREEARQLHTRILRELIERSSDRREDALRHARVLVQVDPLDEQAHATLIELLHATGRPREADEQYRNSRRMLEELNTPVSGALERAHRGEGAEAAPAIPTSDDQVAESGDAPETDPPVSTVLVGRENEMARLGEALAEVVARRRERIVLLSGEPGVGKSRLLAEIIGVARGRGGTVLHGRAYEVEVDRPYGPWIDALRCLAPVSIGPTLGTDLAPLLPELGEVTTAYAGRERLFGGVVDLLAARAHSAPPVLLVIDDVQWCDDASAALLHYAARMSRHRPLLILLAARSGELADNVPMSRVLRTLRREELVSEMRLGPLTPAAIEDLVRSVAPDADITRVSAESGGNPLFALEAARTQHRRGEVPPTLAELVRERLERLPQEAAHLLRWAAVLGQTFAVDSLLQLSAAEPEGVIQALEMLERHALIQGADPTCEAGGAYAFSHDVVRHAVYGDLSAPRRRLMHQRVAMLFEALPSADEHAAEIVHHAELAGNTTLAARACVAAGRLCLRVFANTEAEAFVRRGMRHAQGAPDPECITLQLELQQIAVTARRPEQIDETAAAIQRLAEAAVSCGAVKHARLGFHMVSWLRWEHGEWNDAQRFMLEAERVSRGGDDRERLVAMAEAARCLTLLERDLGHAEALLLEADARSRHLGFESLAVADGLGMLRLHQGELDDARRLFEKAYATAQREGDHDGEFQALAHLLMLEIERQRWREAGALADELSAIAAKLRAGSEGPFARALAGLCLHAESRAGNERLAESIEALRLADAKHRLAFVLTRAAEVDLDRGDAATAQARATTALRTAEILDARSEIAHAIAVLARAAAALGQSAESTRHLGTLRGMATQVLSARARAALESALAPETRSAARKKPGRRSGWNTSSPNASSTLP
jgi:DNA-binding SARP family transcriptional activator